MQYNPERLPRRDLTNSHTGSRRDSNEIGDTAPAGSGSRHYERADCPLSKQRWKATDVIGVPMCHDDEVECPDAGASQVRKHHLAPCVPRDRRWAGIDQHGRSSGDLEQDRITLTDIEKQNARVRLARSLGECDESGENRDGQ